MKINRISSVALIFLLAACSSISTSILTPTKTEPTSTSAFTPLAVITATTANPLQRILTSVIIPNSTTLEITTTSEDKKFVLNGFNGYVFWLSWSKDGKRLFIATEKNGVVIYDIVNQKVIANFEKKLAYGLVIQNIALSPDEKTLAVVIYSTNTIRLISSETGDLLKTIDIPNYRPGQLVFSPDSKMLASVNLYGKDRTVTLWDVAAGTKIKQLFNDNYLHAPIWFTSNGKSLISLIEQGNIGVWDINTEKLQRTFHCDCSGSLSFSPDGKKFITSTKMGGSVWSYESSKKIFDLSSTLFWRSKIVFDLSGKYMAVSSGNGGNDKIMNTITIWDANTGRHLRDLSTGYYIQEDVLAFSPDGAKLASGGYIAGGPPGSQVIIWDISQP